MAARNMNETVAKFDPSTIPDAYCMRASEVTELAAEVIKNPLKVYSVIAKSFYYGYLLGQRAEKASAKKKTA